MGRFDFLMFLEGNPVKTFDSLETTALISSCETVGVSDK